MNWEFYTARRKISLKSFTEAASSLHEAKKIFENKGVDLPVDGSLEVLFEGALSEAPEETEVADLSKTDRQSAAATSNWIATGDPTRESSKSLPKTSVDYLEMGVKPAKEEDADDDKSSDTES